VVHAALDELGLPADQVVMIGDTPYDVEAAGRAGVAIIALRCGGWDDDALKGAIAIYADPADLLAHYDSSPLKHGL
jgi:phosphoglycolate phosphatase-like HAD superfamily hydrolase